MEAGLKFWDMGLHEIANSDMKRYYLALAMALVAATMSLIFLLFKSPATLMLTISAFVIIIAAIVLLGAAVCRDYREGRLKASDQHGLERK